MQLLVNQFLCNEVPYESHYSELISGSFLLSMSITFGYNKLVFLVVAILPLSHNLFHRLYYLYPVRFHCCFMFYQLIKLFQIY
jgi:hypothetical protein